MSFANNFRLTASLAALCFAVALLTTFVLPTALASHTPNPSSVTVAGSLQSELGCGGDWQPECAATHLGYDANDDVWQGVFNVPVNNAQVTFSYNATTREMFGL